MIKKSFIFYTTLSNSIVVRKYNPTSTEGNTHSWEIIVDADYWFRLKYRKAPPSILPRAAVVLETLRFAIHEECGDDQT